MYQVQFTDHASLTVTRRHHLLVLELLSNLQGKGMQIVKITTFPIPWVCLKEVCLPTRASGKFWKRICQSVVYTVIDAILTLSKEIKSFFLENLSLYGTWCFNIILTYLAHPPPHTQLPWIKIKFPVKHHCTSSFLPLSLHSHLWQKSPTHQSKS